MWVISALVWLAYSGTTAVGFYLDDLDNIINREALHLEQLTPAALRGAAEGALLPRRIIANLTLAIDWWRGAGAAVAFQQTNLLLHLINALLVFSLLITIVTRWGAQRAVLPALLGAAIWSVHPIQVQAVSYIIQRMTELSTLFTLLAIILYLYGRQRMGAKAAIAYCGSLLAFACSVLSKESGWITPLLIWLIEVGVIRHAQPFPQRWWWPLFLALPIMLFMAASADILLQGPLYQHFIGPGYANRDFTMLERILTQPRVVLFHISQLLLPLPGRFSLEHEFELSTTLFSPPQTVVAIFTILAWIGSASALLLRAQWRIVGALMLWLPLTLAIESSVIPLEMVFEHRLYLPLFGVAGLAAIGYVSWIERHPTSQRWIIMAGLLGVGGLTYATSLRVALWGDQLQMYQQVVTKAPASERAWGNLGLAYLLRGEGEAALDALNHALVINPVSAVNLINRAQVYYRYLARFQDALNDLNRAVAMAPASYFAVEHRGHVYYRMGAYEAAMRDYERYIRLRPTVAHGFNFHGLAALQLQRYPIAVGGFSKAIELQPSRAEYWVNRGTAHLLSGQAQQAANDLLTAEQLGATEALGLHSNLALAYRQLGDRSRSQHHMDLACRMGNARACGGG